MFRQFPMKIGHLYLVLHFILKKKYCVTHLFTPILMPIQILK